MRTQQNLEGGCLQFLDVPEGHEPSRVPLNLPAGTFSPIEGEGWDEGARSMGSRDLPFWTRIGAVNRTALGSPHSCGSNVQRPNALEFLTTVAAARVAAA
jgi:hypothetical protein